MLSLRDSSTNSEPFTYQLQHHISPTLIGHLWVIIMTEQAWLYTFYKNRTPN